MVSQPVVQNHRGLQESLQFFLPNRVYTQTYLKFEWIIIIIIMMTVWKIVIFFVHPMDGIELFLWFFTLVSKKKRQNWTELKKNPNPFDVPVFFLGERTDLKLKTMDNLFQILGNKWMICSFCCFLSFFIFNGDNDYDPEAMTKKKSNVLSFRNISPSRIVLVVIENDD